MSINKLQTVIVLLFLVFLSNGYAQTEVGTQTVPEVKSSQAVNDSAMAPGVTLGDYIECVKACKAEFSGPDLTECIKGCRFISGLLPPSTVESFSRGVTSCPQPLMYSPALGGVGGLDGLGDLGGLNAWGCWKSTCTRCLRYVRECNGSVCWTRCAQWEEYACTRCIWPW